MELKGNPLPDFCHDALPFTLPASLNGEASTQDLEPSLQN